MHHGLINWGGGNSEDQLMKPNKTKPLLHVLCSNTRVVLSVNMNFNYPPKEIVNVNSLCMSIFLSCRIYRRVGVPVGQPRFDIAAPLSADPTRCRLAEHRNSLEPSDQT